jgi:PAS domain S-box-containing protein
MRIDQFIMSQETVDRLGDVLLLVGLDGSILDANVAALDCYGHSHTEMLALSIHEIRSPGSQDDIDGRMREAAEHGVLFETEHRRRDGTTFPVEVWMAPVSVDGEVALLSVVRDITERKRAERELRESEARYRTLAESSPLAIFVDRDDSVFLANTACVRLFGASSPTDLIGKTVLDLFDAESRILVRARIREAATPFPLVEVRIVRLDGTPVDVEVTASPFLDQGISAIQVVLRDISERKRHEAHIARTLTSVIDIASNIVEVRDPYTSGHQRRVVELAVRIAKSLGMSESEIADISVAGLLHDVGKTAVPAEILSKPGALSPLEFNLIKTHAQAGYQILCSAHMQEPICEMVYQHHERCDGSGYPRGLIGDQILMGAKILAVADVVEAMMSHRPYRAALGVDKAMAEIESGAGSLYDADVARACVALFREGDFEFPE